MSTLEIALILALAFTVFLLVRLYRRHMALRQEFVRSSDWCGRKIKEMAQSAELAIVDLVKQDAARRGIPLPDKNARGEVPYTILNAQQEWFEQKEAFQAALCKGGMRRLDYGDLDRGFSR